MSFVTATVLAVFQSARGGSAFPAPSDLRPRWGAAASAFRRIPIGMGPLVESSGRLRGSRAAPLFRERTGIHKEVTMTKARHYKVQLISETKGEKWPYVGNAYENKNGSVNIYLDPGKAIPMGAK